MRKYKTAPFEVPEWIGRALAVLRPREKLTVSDWAEQNRVLSGLSSATPGKWKNRVTPYLVEIMDAFSDEYIERIIFVKPTQVGGTCAMENMLGCAIDQEPAPALVVYPSDDLAKNIAEIRLVPMIKSCPALAAKFREHESSQLELKFADMHLYLTGANSPADLSSKAVRYLLLDEVDKYPGASKKEADPVSLAIERTKTFHNRKIFMPCTPTLKSGHIWRAKEAAEVEKHYFVPCPHCGEYIELKFGQIKWPDKKELPEAADRAAKAVYVCQKCDGVIGDRDKGAMLEAGRWQVVRQKSDKPKSVAFWLNTLYSPFTTFSEIALEWLRSEDDMELRHNFINSWLAEPWEDTKLKTNADLVLERQTELPMGVLPAWTKLLVGGVDVQENCFYWTIRAWGEGMTSQNVAHGQALSMAEVEQVMNTEFALPNGDKMLVGLALVDSGDQTDEVYEFCLLNSSWALPCKGVDTMQSHYRITTINKPNSRANGQRLVLVDGGKYKSMLAAQMRKPNGRGSWMVYKDCDLEYAEQVTAEHQVSERKKGRLVLKWVLKASHAANHYLDAEVYAAAAADLQQVRLLGLAEREPEEQATETRPASEQQADNDWLNVGGDWLQG